LVSLPAKATIDRLIFLLLGDCPLGAFALFSYSWRALAPVAAACRSRGPLERVGDKPLIGIDPHIADASLFGVILYTGDAGGQPQPNALGVGAGRSMPPLEPAD
jgi:hypothetical protein